MQINDTEVKDKGSESDDGEGGESVGEETEKLGVSLFSLVALHWLT